MSTDPTELDELQSGVTSGFYQRLTSYAEHEWGPAGETFMLALKNATSGPAGSEKEAVDRLKNVMFAQNEIRRLLQWAPARIAQLQQQKEAASRPSGSRRGPGL